MARGEAGRAPPPAAVFRVNAKDLDWVNSKLTRQPNGVVLQPIRLTGGRETIAKKTYIRAPSYQQKAFDKTFEECKADPSWRTYVAENAGHDVMIDQPRGWSTSCCRCLDALSQQRIARTWSARATALRKTMRYLLRGSSAGLT
jgi:hypothetical protein